MYREILRLKPAGGRSEEFKSVLMKLSSLATDFPSCNYFKLYEEENNPGWFLVDSAFDSAEDVPKLLQSETVAPLDSEMKSLLCDGMSIILKTI